MTVALLSLVAYLLGSIPTSLWLAKTRGIDLRQWGSGNLGATNLYRATGPLLGGLCMVVDIAKGFVPTWFFPEVDGVALPQLALLYGAAAVIGHIFSLFARFRGGKGVATGAGVYVALAPAAAGLAFAVWLLVVLATRIVSVASLSAATLLPVAVWLSGHRFDFVFWSSLPLASLVWWTHRSNVRRLLSGREPRVARGSGRPVDPGARPHESTSEA